MEELTLDLDIPPQPEDIAGRAATAEEAQPQVTALEEGQIVDYITGEAIKETEKEKVRQRIARALVHEHGIDPADMARDFRVMVSEEGAQRKRTKSADIAIFESGSLHTTANLRRVVICKPEPKSMGKNVVKLREPDQARKDLEALQELMGNEDRPLCADGMWTDGVDFFFLKKVVSDFGADFEDRSDWAIADGTLGSRTVASHQRLRQAEPERLKIAFRRCHNYIHGNEGMPKDAAFWQFLYLLFAKMYDERVSRGSGRGRFRTGLKEMFEEDGRAAISARVRDLFEDVKREYKDVFKPTDEITLSDRALAFIVSEIAHYDLSGTDVDAKGLAYQELVGTNLRGDRGQYFTPRGAVNLMVEILDPQEDETVLDPTCGTGGFLQATLKHLHDTWKKEAGTYGFPDTDEERERYRDRLKDYAEKHLMGADFDPFLVRATTMAIMTLARDHWERFPHGLPRLPARPPPGRRGGKEEDPARQDRSRPLDQSAVRRGYPGERRVGPRLLPGRHRQVMGPEQGDRTDRGEPDEQAGQHGSRAAIHPARHRVGQARRPHRHRPAQRHPVEPGTDR